MRCRLYLYIVLELENLIEDYLMPFKYCDLGQPSKRLKGGTLDQIRPEDIVARQAKP